MYRREFLRATAASAILCAGLAACAREYVTLRYRLRLVVEIDGLQFEGATVVGAELTNWVGSSLRLPEMPQVESSSRGEAVVISLGERGFRFGLLLPSDGASGFNGSQPEDELSRCLPRPQQSDEENLLRNIQAIQGECQLGESDWPELVRFRDIGDPSSVEPVEPGRFEEVCGPNSRYVGATVSITNDPITVGLIDRALPWLSNAENTLVGKLPPGIRVASEMSLAQRLGIRNFKLSGE